MPTTIAVIQARMGSQRFPGKMLRPLAGVPVIEWVLGRVARAARLDGLVLATTDRSQDDPLVELALRLGIQTHRGADLDVLDRVTLAAQDAVAGDVVRVCADNPFVDPEELDRLIDFYSGNDCDYAWNDQPRVGGDYPDGFGGEILSVGLLNDLSRRTTEPDHREHVTSYLWDNRAGFALAPVPVPEALAFPELSFDVDEPSDLIRLEKLVKAESLDVHSPAADIVQATIRQTAEGSSAPFRS